MLKSELHLHTNFCDGENSPEEMVVTAIERGFEVLGFSGHSYTEFDSGYCMNSENIKEYYDTVNRLKYQYKDKINIFCGIEQDYYSKPTEFDFDYVIGSVHYVKKNNQFLPMDDSPQLLLEAVNNFYGGSFDALAEDYFKIVSDMPNNVKADIIGHFDLVSKFSDVLGISQSERYLKAAFSAVKELIAFDIPFEINVGAMVRGYRTSPYPSAEILKEINRLGGKIIISGDCHNKENLGKYFDKAVELAKKCGFDTAVFLTENGFRNYYI